MHPIEIAIYLFPFLIISLGINFLLIVLIAVLKKIDAWLQNSTSR